MDAPHVHRWILGRPDATGGSPGECACHEERYFNGGLDQGRAAAHTMALSGVNRRNRRVRDEWKAYHAAAVSMAQIPNIETRADVDKWAIDR